ncbi:MAG TPA: class I SAM-dependent methyltransferase [Polyangia bacterium]|nr:class I SAM-dependent methyltransferase [Polyangia bacterium]
MTAPEQRADPLAEMLINRVRKNRRRLAPWLAREGVTCYRLYDRDIPEIPLVVDWYEGRLHASSYARDGVGETGEARHERLARAMAVLAAALGVPAADVHVKRRVRAPGGTQYGRLARTGKRFTVAEGDLAFWVNLEDYADTGLFLDHRRLRALVRAEAADRRFLNLFAYTGAFSVHAAAGGARETVSVDLSNTYLAWARDNLALGGFFEPDHRTVRDDVLGFLEGSRRRGEGGFDLVVIDPPTISRSKKMACDLDVQRDHPRLIEGALALCRPGAVVYFSTNFSGFELRLASAAGLAVEDITRRTTPADFRTVPHRCFRITAGSPLSDRKPTPLAAFADRR